MPDDGIESRALAQLDRLAEQDRSHLGLEPWAAIDTAIERLYHDGGLPRGELTGWPGLDAHYTVAGQCLTLITGIPGMGKSEFLDALLVNLAESGKWHCVLWSPENPVGQHAIKLLEKRARKPYNPGLTPRMSEREMLDGKDWIRAHFDWLKAPEATLIELVRAGISLVRERAPNLAIAVDPWNYLDHYDPVLRPPGASETEYVSRVLSQVTTLLRSPAGEGVHVFLVAHPRQLYRDREGRYPIPNGYDISGSAHFFNKSDAIIAINRDKHSDAPDVEIHVQKIRFKHHGRLGIVNLRYDRVTGRYFPPSCMGIMMDIDPERGSQPPTLREPGEEG